MNKTCEGCGNGFCTEADFYFQCKRCEDYFCADCGIESGTECPACGGELLAYNEEGA